MDEQISELLKANSLLLDRMKFEGGKTHGGKRDLYEIFGYKKNLQPEDFRDQHERGHIASRIVTAYPDAVWSNPPELVEDEESQDDTEFEKQFKKLAKDLNLWHYLHRADVLAQLGRFSVLFIGIADGQDDLTQPAGTGAPTYLMPFGETNAEIKTFDRDVKSERYGKPLIYSLTVDTADGEGGSETIEVHASRCIHIAERLLDNDVYGTSILKAIFNKLEDLEKVSGGSAETFWTNARGGLNVNADKDVEITDAEDLKKQIDNYIHKLTRVIRTQGMDVKTLDQQVNSPKDQASMLLDLISGTTGIPKRILVGSERGELASSQDEDNWASRVDERRELFCGPCVLKQLVDTFVKLGALKEVEEWQVKWPQLITLSDEKKAEIATKKAQALSTYANSVGADSIITPEQFVVEILDEEYREDDLLKMQDDEDDDIDEQLKLEGLEPPEPQEQTEPTE